GLRVEMPGRAPYDVTVKTTVPSAMMWADAVNGRTFPVQIDSANPQNVRVDFSAPPQSGSFGLPDTTTQGMSYVGQPPFNAPQPPAGSPYDFGSSPYGYIPPSMRWLSIASACFLGIGTIAALGYQAHVWWGVYLRDRPDHGVSHNRFPLCLLDVSPNAQ